MDDFDPEVAALAGADLVVVERLLRESHTWAYVDALAGTVTSPAP